MSESGSGRPVQPGRMAPLARVRIAVRVRVRRTTAGVQQALHERLRGIIFIQVMNDALEKRLIEALKSVDAHGDVAPAHVHDPMTMLLRENAVQANLVRWSEDRGRYVLTGTGRRRISAGSRVPGTVLSFRRLGAVGGIAPPRNPAGTNLKD